MWFISVRTSHPSHDVGASSFETAPATLVEVHSLARRYRSSRSRSIASLLSVPAFVVPRSVSLHTIAHQGRPGKPQADATAALAPAKRPNIVLSPMESPLA